MDELTTIKARLEQKTHESRLKLQRFLEANPDGKLTSVQSAQLQVCSSVLTKLIANLKEAKEAFTYSLRGVKGQNKYKDDLLACVNVSMDAEEILSELDVYSNTHQTSSTASSSVAHVAPNQIPAATVQATVRLPKIEPVKFGGNIVYFKEFWDSFEINIESTSLKPLQKFSFLKSYLFGEPLRQISGLPLTDENYEVAKSLLHEKYGDSSIVIQKLYHRLTALYRATSDVSSVRNTFDRMEMNLRALEALGEDVNNSTILFNVLLQKFPMELFCNSNVTSASLKTVGDIRSTVKEILLFREKLSCVANHSSSSSASSNKTASKPRQSHVNTTDALLTGTAAYRGLLSAKCHFCTGKHWSDECDLYTTVKARKAQIKGSCFICLKSGHDIKECKTKSKPCTHCQEVGKHHRSLCIKKFPLEQVNSDADDAAVAAPALLCSLVEDGMLQTALVYVRSNDTRYKARLVLDSGSVRSYITNSLAKKLNAKTAYTEALRVRKMGESPKVVNTNVVSYEIELPDNTRFSITANAVPAIANEIPAQDFSLVESLPAYKDLPFAEDDGEAEIELLIGGDYFYDLFKFEKIEVRPNLYLLNFKIGWILGGRTKNEQPSPAHCLLVHTAEDANVSQLWELDTLGIKDNLAADEAEQHALNNFYSNIVYDQQRYTVSWPWREFPPPLHDNFHLALGQLKALTKRLDADKLSAYDSILQEQVKSGIIEKVEFYSAEPKHYLPHHAVITPAKTTPLRIVYNGSAKLRTSHKSLNDCLFKGKVLIEDLAALLLRFRTYPIAITCDISKAFLQIGLKTSDRDVVRFLWWKDLKASFTDENLQIFRFTRIPFGVVSSPFLLQATIRHHLLHSRSELAQQLINDIYVDNIITGTHSKEKAIHIPSELTHLFNAASMRLHSWSSNSKEVLDQVPDLAPMSTVGLLGLNWDSEADTLEVKIPPTVPPLLSKRTILQITNGFYDPLGLFSPIQITAKIFIKYLWQQKLDWDTELSEADQFRWKEIAAKLQSVRNFPLPRHVLVINEIEIHCFVDASKEAYASAVYVRNLRPLTSTLVFSKARVSPLKNTTIPRLELLAAVVGVRSVQFVQKSLNTSTTIKSAYIWTDSKCVLHWIYSTKMWPTFVERRVREIRSQGYTFRYVPTAQNPADLPSRGCLLDDMTAKGWWHGPPFLLWRESEWPPQPDLSQHEDVEVVHSAPVLATQILQLATVYGIPENKFSSFSKLLKTTAYVTKAIQLFKKITDVKKLTIDDIENAKSLWLRAVQQNYFPDINTSLLKQQLNIHTNQGLLRCGGRLANADLTEAEKFPLLLPTNAPFTKLLILDVHRTLHHAGTIHTLARLRKEFWIPKGRSAVFHTLKKMCYVCKYMTGPPYRAPPMPDLPHFRVEQSHPFKNTGADIFGHLYVTREGKKQKVWVLLFTCLVTRAIHLELLENLTAVEFLGALIKFVSRKQKPDLILTDNAPQFRLIDKAFDTDSEFQTYLLLKKIEWKFIPACSPWMGGVYERMVSLAKDSLKRTLFKTCISFRHLEVLLAEIEATLNDRPLIYTGDTFPTGTVLTPARLLHIEYQSLGFTLSDSGQKMKQEILEVWKKGQAHLNRFWTIWKDQYLLALRERFTRTIKQQRITSTQIPKVGSIVLIEDPLLNRGNWKIGKITALTTSHDGHIRSAELQLPNNRNITRPIIKLYPLELDIEEEK